MALEGNLVLLTQLAIAILSLSLLGTLAISQATSRSSYGVNSTNIAQTFEQWMAKYGRIYPNGQEEGKRSAIFGTNLEMPTSSTSFRYQNMSDDDVPNSIDWRKQGAVTPVKYQAGCGCCWAFSAVAAVEGITKIRTGQLIPLSGQQLVDCNRDMYNIGCEGGNMVDAFRYIKKNGGITSEDNYQYTARDGACDSNKEKQHAATITGFEQVPRGEMHLLKAVSMQPVSVHIDAHGRDFKHYSSGVFSGDGGTKLNHAVVVVGYGKTEDGIDYWLLKNSWSEQWGENGYMRILRNASPPEGQCGIAMRASYPTTTSEIHNSRSERHSIYSWVIALCWLCLYFLW
ncbi:senescence-specific cysteine protease SAG39 [Rosa sericea]